MNNYLLMRKYIIAALIAIVVAAFALYGIFLWPCIGNGEESTYIYIRDNDTPETVKSTLSEAHVRTTGFDLLNKALGYKVRSGRYVVKHGDNLLTLFRRLRNGQQEPVNLTIPSVRTLDRLAAHLGEHLMMDSVEINTLFHDSAFCARLGYSPETLPSLFIPNTYEVYWNISIEGLMERMQHENEAFWDGERERKARAMGLSHVEVVTLASIVDEETANNAEKPMVAGMYIKRLAIGMPLQADPTVKFAIGDFSLRRIWGRHLTIDSPYNTYKIVGLPPGPIRIPSIAGIDAVLNHVPHDYLYMCAKEDFSGTHNFAKTYAEHLRNARRYAQALNARNIK